MFQHIHHVCAADTFRVVHPRILVAALAQLTRTFFGVNTHVFFAAKADGAGRTGFYARRGLPHRHAIRTQRAFVGLVIDLGNARHVERTAGDAIAAADAVFGNEIDYTVGVFDDGARRRTRLQAAGLRAMHAAVFADQPFQFVFFDFDFEEAHQCPRARREIGRIVVNADVGADLIAQIVPVHARDLARFATDAF